MAGLGWAPRVDFEERSLALPADGIVALVVLLSNLSPTCRLRLTIVARSDQIRISPSSGPRQEQITGTYIRSTQCRLKTLDDQLVIRDVQARITTCPHPHPRSTLGNPSESDLGIAALVIGQRHAKISKDEQKCCDTRRCLRRPEGKTQESRLRSHKCHGVMYSVFTET